MAAVVSRIALTLEVFNPKKSKLRMFPILDSIVFQETQNSLLTDYGELKMKQNHPEIAQFLIHGYETEEEQSKSDLKKCSPLIEKSTITTVLEQSGITSNDKGNDYRN